jgi:hypothetical protein
MKISIELINRSISACYLPENFISLIREREDKLTETDTGYYALRSETITTADGYTYHEENDSDMFVYDEWDEDYICESDAVQAHGRRRNLIVTHKNNCIYFEGNHYLENYLDENGIITLHNGDYCHIDEARYVEDEGEYYHGDDVYYWESDNEYHLEPEEEEETATSNKLWDYNSGPREKYLVNEDATGSAQKFGWGIEIEKSKFPSFDFSREEVYEETGAVLEKDSSVSSGFELKTPTYNLFSPKTEERLKQLENFCNIDGIENAGGHIGFSMEGKTDIELLNLCRGFLPLIYAMYKKRAVNHYCEAKKISKLIKDKDKFQSIRLRDNYIEFRIFSGVKSFYTIMFRLRLFRIIASNLGASFGKVLNMAATEGTELNTLLTERAYKNESDFIRLITDAKLMDEKFGTNRMNQETLNKITDKIRKHFADKKNSQNNLGE